MAMTHRELSNVEEQLSAVARLPPPLEGSLLDWGSQTPPGPHRIVGQVRLSPQDTHCCH